MAKTGFLLHQEGWAATKFQTLLTIGYWTVISEDLYILLLLNFSSFELEPNHAFVFLEDRVEGSESVNYDVG